MTEDCRCNCHERTITCTPCWQLHHFVEWLDRTLVDTIAEQRRAISLWPAIAAEKREAVYQLQCVLDQARAYLVPLGAAHHIDALKGIQALADVSRETRPQA